jgi:hypothetical protein
VPRTPPNHLVATDVSIVKIEAELAVGGDIINRGKCAIRTTIVAVLADNADETAITEHILLKRLAIDGTEKR